MLANLFQQLSAPADRLRSFLAPAAVALAALLLSSCCLSGRETAAFRGSADLIPIPGAEEEIIAGELAPEPEEEEVVQRPQIEEPEVAPGQPIDWLEELRALDNVIYFEFDLARLSSTAVRTLRRWVSRLKRYPQADLTIKGHTDSRGTRDYNLWLGERRAKSIQDFLETRGIEGKRVRISSYGEEDPAVRGSNAQAHALNRRALLIPEPSRGD